jgi:sortase (surface protein transpeptidase)
MLRDAGVPPPSSGPTLIIPAIGVRAAIIPEGIDKTPGDVGNLTVPWAANEVGWWDGGPAPGQGGVAVMTGHRVVNWAFWRLPDLRAGDAIEVIGTNGQLTHWTVQTLQEMPKADLPSSLWVEGGVPKLALVTCGGPFNNSTRHYRDNIVVWATPAST